MPACFYVIKGAAVRYVVTCWSEKPTEDLVLGRIVVANVTCKVCIVQCWCDRSGIFPKQLSSRGSHMPGFDGGCTALVRINHCWLCVVFELESSSGVLHSLFHHWDSHPGLPPKAGLCSEFTNLWYVLASLLFGRPYLSAHHDFRSPWPTSYFSLAISCSLVDRLECRDHTPKP